MAAAIVLLIFMTFLLQALACAGILRHGGLLSPDRMTIVDYGGITQKIFFSLPSPGKSTDSFH